MHQAIRFVTIAAVATIAAFSLVGSAAAQGRPDPEKIMSTQRAAMSKLAAMDGTWRGSAWTILPNGEKLTLTQTERVGPLLSGSIKVVEGRGYDIDGKTIFNALGVISFDVAKDSFNMHANAEGRTGNYVVTPMADGFSWEIVSGPVTIRYVATIKNGTWKEVGDVMLPGQPPKRTFEMTLTRLGDSNWPEAGAVGTK